MRQDIKSVDEKVDKCEQGAKEALTESSDRLDEVEEDLKDRGKDVKNVQSQFIYYKKSTRGLTK
jgi:uncharacterized protein with GYD domain